MSVVSENAALTLILADFANNDAGGKLNVIGGGIQAIGYEFTQGTTTRFSVIAQVELDSQYCPQDFVIELTLTDESGAPVPLPGQPQSSVGGVPQSLRIGQAVKIEKPAVQGFPTFPASIPGRVGLVIDFGNGIPVPAGQAYAWQLRVDGDGDSAVTAPFFVPGPPSLPVVG